MSYTLLRLISLLGSQGSSRSAPQSNAKKNTQINNNSKPASSNNSNNNVKNSAKKSDPTSGYESVGIIGGNDMTPKKQSRGKK
jgi:hypothetical protein